MKISEAEGKLKVGMRVRTNGDAGDVYNFYFTGVIIKILDNYFAIKRDDMEGNWLISSDNDRAQITILYKPMDTPQKAKYGLCYKRDTDPTEYFATVPALIKRVDELVEDESVDKDSIFYFTLANKVQVKPSRNYQLVKIK